MNARQPKNHQKIGDARKDAQTYNGIDLAILDRAIPNGLPKGAAAVARELLAVAARLEREAAPTEDDLILGASTATLLLAFGNPTPRRDWLINWLRHVEAAIREEDEY